MIGRVRAFVFGSLTVIVLCSASVYAQTTRTFVSANGNDTNSCTRVAPCRTLAVALSKTNAGGEINVLDPAGYGTVVIDRAISIVNEGVGSAGVLVPAGSNGITINAGPSDNVNLRGLVIEGAGVGANGVRFNTGKSLTIENCVVRNLVNDGINFRPTGASSLAVSNTLVADNAGSGVVVYPNGSGRVGAVLNRVEAYHNGVAGNYLNGDQNANLVAVTVSDSVAGSNGDTGFIGQSSMGASYLTLIRSVAANNLTGVRAVGGAAFLFLGQSTLSANINGWSVSGGGFVGSFGDNYMVANESNQSAPPPAGKN